MKHWHMLLCAAVVAVGVILAAAGAGALAFIPILGCVAMMGMMVWMMVRH